MGARTGGRLMFTVDGQAHFARGNFYVTLGSVTRKSVAGQDRPHGYIEMPGDEPGIQGELTTQHGLSLGDLRRITGSVTVELANGRTYVLTDWTERADDIGGDVDDYEVEFRGSACEEI